MKYDTIIIGGSEAALIAGLELAAKGCKTAIVSNGQTFLHCSSGSLGLLGYDSSGREVLNPLDVIGLLPQSHPYSKIGTENVSVLTQEVKKLFTLMGIPMHGNHERNHYRLSPVGVLKPAWLTMDECPVVSVPDEAKTWGRVLLLGIEGFFDFFPEFIASGLEAVDVHCEIKNIGLPKFSALRVGSTEKMRATQIARAIVSEKDIDAVALCIDTAAREAQADTVIMPAVFGIDERLSLSRIKSKISCRIMFMPTMPVSVTGLYCRARLEAGFREAGGTLLYGDNVSAGKFVNGRLESVSTCNMPDMPLYADNFILATGNFINHGLESSPSGVREPLFGLDVDMNPVENGFTNIDFFSAQPYMECGVATDSDFRVSLGGNTICNLYAAGAILGGCNSLKEESGAGVEYISGLAVAKKILEKEGGLK